MVTKVALIYVNLLNSDTWQVCSSIPIFKKWSCCQDLHRVASLQGIWFFKEDAASVWQSLWQKASGFALLQVLQRHLRSHPKIGWKRLSHNMVIIISMIVNWTLKISLCLGPTVVIFHVSISLISLGFFYLLVSRYVLVIFFTKSLSNFLISKIQWNWRCQSCGEATLCRGQDVKFYSGYRG